MDQDLTNKTFTGISDLGAFSVIEPDPNGPKELHFTMPDILGQGVYNTRAAERLILPNEPKVPELSLETWRTLQGVKGKLFMVKGDLHLLGNFDEVQECLDSAIADLERVAPQKSEG